MNKPRQVAEAEGTARCPVQHSHGPCLRPRLSGIGGVRHGTRQIPVGVTTARFARTVRPPLQSMSPVEQRLASAERELHIQFTRIAQLQAEFDLLQAALRRSRDGTLMR
jgi:hypothetical protein